MDVSLPAAPGPEPVNILVVDDRAENRLALRAILSSPEYRILEAASEKEALRHLLHEDFAVLLLDVVMPGMDGFELAELIRQRERMSSVPIIFLTAEAVDHDMVRKAYAAGAADYLIKPLLPEMVRAKVGVFAELYRQRRRIEAQSARLLEVERRQSEHRVVELRQASERRYRNLAEAVPHIVWTADEAGRIDYFNRRWFEYTGLSRDETDGSWFAALHPDDRTGSEAAWQAALESGQPFELVCRLRRPGGSYRWQLCRALPETAADGGVLSWLGTFTDVDEQRRAQGVLSEFKGMLDAVLDAVFIFDADCTQVLYVNQGASYLLGYPLDELMASEPAAVLPLLAEEQPRDMLTPLAGRKATVETVCLRRSGIQLPVELSLQLVESGGGRIIAIARDISERKQGEAMREFLYEKALDAVQARDEFLSIASHELRTPLAALSLQVQMLQRYLGKPVDGEPTLPLETVVPKVDMIGQQVARLVRLIDELLDLSRISGGQFRIERAPMDLAEVAREVVSRYAEEAEKAACRVVLEADKAVAGEWDPMRIEQVLTNLLTNALKFGAGKPVEVMVKREGEFARLAVRDHGIGIPEDAQARIFQRFERSEGAERFSGLGLGLYITKRIVDAHGGSIGIASQPGAGTAFSVLLPLVWDEAEATEAEPAAEGEVAEARLAD